jgi:hemimethylated DNA binding protein
MLLGAGPDPLDQGFAALRQASRYNEFGDKLVDELQSPSLGVPTCKLRTDAMLFACGDICQHRFFGRCVVVGWDEMCKQDESWVRTNRVRENLKFGTDQTFYLVLLERDNVPRYCSQENLALAAEGPHFFAHTDSSFYFRGVGRSHTFVPSDALAFIYPEDRAFASGKRDYRPML